MPDLLQVAAVADTSIRDFIQYVVDAAAVGAFVFVWRTNTVLAEIRTLLSAPDTGLVARVEKLSSRSHDVNNDLHEHGVRLEGHGVRLDGHDRELGEIKEERRHSKRRAEDRGEE